MSSIRVLILMGTVAAFWPAAAQANLITNPGFELPNYTGTGYAILASIPGWTAVTLPPGGGIEIQYGSVAGAPHSGDQLVELDSNENSGMYQDIAVLPGGAYTLSFWYSPRPGSLSGNNAIDVYWDGLQVGPTLTGLGGGATVWTQYVYTVIGDLDGTSRLYFEAPPLGGGNTYGGYLDDVSLEPVPEPATLLLLGSGLTGLALRRRRRS